MMKKIVFSVILLSSSIYTNAQQLLEVLKHQTIDIAFTLPSGVSIEKGRYIVASTLDSNYLPFSAPTTPATWDRNIDPDATAEAKTLDFQGIIPERGVLVHIPITVASVGTNPKIPAYTQTINIPAWKTEDGNSRNLTLSWTEQPYDANTKFIRAILKPDGELKVKKLDLNAGLGNDYQGVELGVFNYTYNYTNGVSSGSSKFEVRALAGIPDRNFGVVKNVTTSYIGFNSYESWSVYGPYPYDLIYFPVEVNGKIWLNNNLGAAYNRVSFQGFAPYKQADSRQDGYAYGNVYQWQRPADGHELKRDPYTSASVGIYQLGSSLYPIDDNRGGELADSWMPNHSKFIYEIPMREWNKNYDDGNYDLWKANGSNNPCPYGFHVPTMEEWLAAAAHLSKLKLPNTGGFDWSAGHYTPSVGNIGYYWSSDVVSGRLVGGANGKSHAKVASTFYRDGSLDEDSVPHSIGLSIRCIQD